MLEQSWKKKSRATTKSVPLLQSMGFVNRMDQNVAKYWYPNEKMVVVPVCLNDRCCYSGCVGIASYWQRQRRRWASASSSFSKTCCQCDFSEIFKERQIILEPFRKSKYHIRYLLWWHKTLPGAIWTKEYSKPL